MTDHRDRIDGSVLVIRDGLQLTAGIPLGHRRTAGVPVAADSDAGATEQTTDDYTEKMPYAMNTE
jgi:hypothetical protein